MKKLFGQNQLCSADRSRDHCVYKMAVVRFLESSDPPTGHNSLVPGAASWGLNRPV